MTLRIGFISHGQFALRMYGHGGRTLVYRPVEGPELTEIALRQREEPNAINEMFDRTPVWAPLAADQLKEYFAAEMKKPHTAIMAIYSGDTFVGISEWSANWDTWAPYAWVVIWPEHRRKGHGSEAAGTLLERTFMDSPAHSLSAAVPEFNRSGTAFLKRLGFREIGRMRRAGMADGNYYDTLFFDLLRSEYAARGKGVRR